METKYIYGCEVEGYGVYSYIADLTKEEVEDLEFLYPLLIEGKMKIEEASVVATLIGKIREGKPCFNDKRQRKVYEGMGMVTVRQSIKGVYCRKLTEKEAQLLKDNKQPN